MRLHMDTSKNRSVGSSLGRSSGVWPAGRPEWPWL